MIEVSVEQEVVSCFRCEGQGCPRCDGTGFRPVRRCTGCGERSGKPSEGGKSLLGLRSSRSVAGPLYCMDCHPENMPVSYTILLKWIGSGVEIHHVISEPLYVRGEVGGEHGYVFSLDGVAFCRRERRASVRPRHSGGSGWSVWLVALKLVLHRGAVGEGEVRGVAPPVSDAIFKAS